MRANSVLSIASLCALSVVLSGASILFAQEAPTAPADQTAPAQTTPADQAAPATPADQTAPTAPTDQTTPGAQGTKTPPAKKPAPPAPEPALPMAPVETATQDSANDLSVAVGKSVLVDFTAPIRRAAIGQNEIAEVTATSSTELMINGKTTGQTSLIVWEKGGERQFFNVTVRSNTFGSTDKIDAVRRELRTELPGQQIKISAENGSVFLRGNAKDLDSADRAVAIASTLLTNKEAKVVNLLYVDVPPPEKQILLKVRFASIDRNKAKSMGINLFDLGLGNAAGGISTGQFTPPQLGASAATSTSSGAASPGQLNGSATTAVLTNELNMLAFFPGLNAGADIEALETQGVAQILAEPNVIAMNGKQASFLAGGEYPFPVAQGGGAGGAATISIQWKEYGVRLNFIPTITPRGTIHLQVAPEVSALDYADAVQVSGYEVPALTVRRMMTEAELADGQSIVIGGLLDNRETELFDKVPFLGDIPILGKLFQSMTKTRTNTELIVIVTPEFIDPIPVGAALPQLKYPAKFLPPNTGIPLNSPDAKPAGETPAAAPSSIPVETLVNSNKPEPALVDSGSSGGASSGGAKSGSSY